MFPSLPLKPEAEPPKLIKKQIGGPFLWHAHDTEFLGAGPGLSYILIVRNIIIYTYTYLSLQIKHYLY